MATKAVTAVTLEGRTLSHATIPHIDIAPDVHLDGCTVDTITGVINGMTTITRMTKRPEWRDVTCIDPIGIDDASLPNVLSGVCEMFTDDANRLARYAEDVYTHLLVYTATFDCALDLVTEIDGEISVSRDSSSIEMAHNVRKIRAQVLAGEVRFARLAWRDENRELGYIEIEIDRTMLDPTEGDPHVFWHRADSYVHLDYMQSDAEALLGHLDR